MQRIEVIQADITKLEVDAIVNAANRTLLGGGGVDGAIHRAAGSNLRIECQALGGCVPGAAKITKGYQLPAKYIIHTVGPIWHGGDKNEAQVLASCYRESLKLAVEHNIKSIAFPAISCGLYGYPIEQAVRIAVNEVKNFLANDQIIEKVYFVCFNADIFSEYLKVLILRNPG